MIVAWQRVSVCLIPTANSEIIFFQFFVHPLPSNIILCNIHNAKKYYLRKLECICELSNAVWFSGRTQKFEASLFATGSPKEIGRLSLNSLSAFHRSQGNPLSVGPTTTRRLLRSVCAHTTRRRNRWLNIIRNVGSILALMQQSPRMLSFVMY